MRRNLRPILYVAAIIVWGTAVSFAAVKLWRYDAAPGIAADAPPHWPADSHVARTPGLPTLVVLLHPHCPCSRATIGELAKLMTDCRGKLSATVLVVRPDGMSDDWVHSDLWTSAAAIPGVKVAVDDQGIETHRFGTVTSGEALLYSADGTQLFAGGITESRGHSGDNAGSSAIAALVLGDASAPKGAAHTPVYGCPLFDGPGSCRNDGSRACRK